MNFPHMNGSLETNQDFFEETKRIKTLPPLTMYNKKLKYNKDVFLDGVFSNLNNHTKNNSKTRKNSESYFASSTCYSTTYNMFYTNTSFSSPTLNSIYTNDAELDTEMKNLRKYYYDGSQKADSYSKAQKKEIFNKYNIKNNISTEEIGHIFSLMRKSNTLINEGRTFNNTNVTANRGLTTTVNNISLMSKTIVTTDVEEYKDPIKAMKKLKANRQIHDNVVNMVTTKQIQKYKEKFMECYELNSKLEKMPPARVTSDILTVRIKEKMKENDQTNMMNTTMKQNVYEYDEPSTEKNKSKKVKLLSREDMLTNEDYYGSLGPFSKFRPSARSQTVLVFDRDKNMYLIGGVNTERLFDFWKCDLNTLTWKSIRPLGEMPLSRMGHSAVLYRSQIFIYGGNVENEAEMPKEDLTVFNIEQNRVYIERCFNKTNLKWRRNHIGVCFGYTMIIQGGIDESGEFLSDSFILDLESFRWTEVVAKEDSFKPLPVAYHSAAVVVTSEKRNMSNCSIYKFADLQRNFNHNIKHEGIYLFGGIDKDGNCNNTLRIIKIGKKPLEWYKPNWSGMPPAPRHSATLSFFEDLEVLIVHGGRDDKSSQVGFNDTFIFDLYHLKWIQLNVFDTVPRKRAEHSAVVYNNKLLIFGGTNTASFVGSDLYYVDLDYFQNKKKKEEYDHIDVILCNKNKFVTLY